MGNHPEMRRVPSEVLFRQRLAKLGLPLVAVSLLPTSVFLATRQEDERFDFFLYFMLQKIALSRRLQKLNHCLTIKAVLSKSTPTGEVLPDYIQSRAVPVVNVGADQASFINCQLAPASDRNSGLPG